MANRFRQKYGERHEAVVDFICENITRTNSLFDAEIVLQKKPEFQTAVTLKYGCHWLEIVDDIYSAYNEIYCLKSTCFG